MQALDTASTPTSHRHHHQHQLVGGGGNGNGADNNNLTHAAHCVSCVFLNEIAMAKHSHTLGHNNNANNNLHSNNTSHHSNSNSATSHQTSHNTANTMNTSSNHSNNNHNNPLAPTAATTLHHLQHHAPPHHLQQQQHPSHLSQQQHLLPHQHHQPQQQQQQPQPQPQPHQYNMNSSDYSSSTYHIYDQISDLIIIKQQRMERKRQVAHRKKLVLLAVLATSLVVGSIYLITRLVASISLSSSQVPSPADQLMQTINNNSDNNNQVITTFDSAILSRAQWPPPQVALPGGARMIGSQQPSTSRFDASQWQQALSNNQNNVILCSNRGTVIINPSTGEPAWPCKCQPGFYGDRCESPVGSGSDSSHAIALCLQHNCRGNGQCNSQGKCQCLPGFVGHQCEYKLTASSVMSPASVQIDEQAKERCAVMFNNCNGRGSCTSSGQCRCFAGFQGPACQEQAPAVATGDVCALSQRPCLNGGLCVQWNASCQCKPGYFGAQCEQQSSGQQTASSSQQDSDQLADQQQQQAGAPGGAGGFAQVARRRYCSGNGHFDAVSQKCDCDAGFSGPNCAQQVQVAQKDKGDQSTSSQQQQPKQQSSELAKQSQNGNTCDTADQGDSDQQFKCGSYGVFDCRQNKCVCQDGFSGDRCQHQRCSAQCLRNGQCVEGVCVCQPGYYGKQCSLNGCPNNCSGRGQCVRSITTTAGAGAASSTGELAMVTKTTSASSSNAILQPEWHCQCPSGTMGDDCSQLVERQCDDKIDNDSDGLIDCADSECCSDKACQNSTLCMKSPDPLDILMRKQPSPPTSSFFQRMQFLIEKSQTYSNPKDFNDSTMASKHVDRASVIRGRVTYMKQGITGVKVSVAGQINLGITLTRDNGWFDLMVNGGGAVLVEFRREPFAILQKAVRVPWSEIVLMDNVELSLESQLSPEAAISPNNNNNNLEAANHQQQRAPSCLAHNYRLMKPSIMAGPVYRLAGRQQHQEHQEHQVRQPIPINTNQRISINSAQQTISPSALDISQNSNSNNNNQSISLVYISSRANEFMSTISMQLTPEQITVMPNELSLIHVRIVIEGNLYEQMFEPQANLTFTYAWNRRNAYRQKSFGLSTAIVSVGYEYFDCQQTIWTTKHVQIAGHDLTISEIGNGWNLNIHHRYNYRDAILQRGDGQNFDLKTDKPRKVQPLMGDGYQRQAICPYCDSGSALPQEQRLYRPQALVSAPDGSLYVGDANLVRRIESTERTVRTVLELSPQRTPQRYNLALSLTDQRLYMIDPERFQVYWVRGATTGSAAGSQASATGMGSSPTTGAPAELAGAAASAAQLMNDSGLTNGEESLVPIIGSGTKCVWTSDSSGDDSDRLANCGDGQAARQAHLIDPRALVFDIKGRMYLADGPNVRMIDLDGKIYTILGDYGQQQQQHQHQRHHHHQSQHQQQQQFPCSGEAIPMHKYVPKMPIDLAINPIDETLHVLDDNVVYKVTQDKRVQIVAGQLSHCAAVTNNGANKDVSSNRFAGEPLVRATEYSLQSAQSIGFNQNGELFISEDDQKQALSRVLIVEPEDDTISLFAGLPIDIISGSSVGSSANEQQQQQQQQDKQHISNLLPRLMASQSGAVPSAPSASSPSSSTSLQLSSGTTLGSTMSSSSATGISAARATEYKFSSIEAIAIDQRGNLIVADRIQLRLLSVEPDLPQISSSGEYELVSPDNPNELLVFNRFGHHTATREFVQASSGIALTPVANGAAHHHHLGHGHGSLSGHQHSAASTLTPLHHPFQRAQASANSNAGNSHHQNGLITKYTFTYTVNTSLGQLVSVGLVSSGNKISIYREGPHHQVRMIETAFGGQCKLDISRSGQVHSLSTYGPNRSPCCTCVRPADSNSNSPSAKTPPARCECMITTN